MKNNFRVCLTGGLGNQFFQIAAGLYVSKNSGLECQFIESFDGFSKYNHKNEIEFFPNIVLRKRTNRASRAAALSYRVTRKASLKSKLVSRLLKIDASNQVGYVGELSNIKSGWELRGYYQCFKYLQAIKPEIKSLLSIKEPSIWLEEMRRKAKNTYVVSLHIRRGDYVTLSDRHGLLSTPYYTFAIEAVLREFPESVFWVFSDDIGIARTILQGVNAELKFIDPPVNTPAAESLVLMWECKGHIIANSTFSWWGAALADESKITIAPDLWMKNGMVIEDLYLPEWKLIPSQY